MPPLRILLRIDASHDVGLGHAVRSAALLDRLRARGLALEAQVLGRGVGLRHHDLGAHVEDPDPAARGGALLERGVHLLWVDHPAPEPRLMRDARERGVPVFAVDDFGGELPADLIVNGTPVPEQHVYRGQPRGCRVLAGVRYALLRPCFRAARVAQATLRRSRHSVTVALGSGEGAVRFARALFEAPLDLARWGDVTLVVGSAFPEARGWARRCAARGVRFRRDVSGEALAHQLTGSALALTTGGMLVLESLAAGVPTLAHPQVPGTEREVAWLAARGALVDLGPDAWRSAEAVDEAVRRWLDDAPGRRTLARRAAAQVDGRGLDRVAEAVARLLGAPLAQVDAPRRATG